MKKVGVLIIISLLITISFVGCISQQSDSKLSLNVVKVEKRLYTPAGRTAPSSTDDGTYFLYVFFTIKNNDEEIYSYRSNTLGKRLISPEGTNYNSYWMDETEKPDVIAYLEKGETIGDYYIFEMPEEPEIDESWYLFYDNSIPNAKLTNIQSGFNDVFYATVRIVDYYFEDDESSSKKTLYVTISVKNSASNQIPIKISGISVNTTNGTGFALFESIPNTEPDNIIPGAEASWQLYGSIPHNATLDSLTVNVIGASPPKAVFFE